MGLCWLISLALLLIYWWHGRRNKGETRRGGQEAPPLPFNHHLQYFYSDCSWQQQWLYFTPKQLFIFSESVSGKHAVVWTALLQFWKAMSQTQLSTDRKRPSESPSVYFNHISKTILTHSPRGGRRMLFEPSQCWNAWSWQYRAYT